MHPVWSTIAARMKAISRTRLTKTTNKSLLRLRHSARARDTSRLRQLRAETMIHNNSCMCHRGTCVLCTKSCTSHAKTHYFIKCVLIISAPSVKTSPTTTMMKWNTSGPPRIGLERRFHIEIYCHSQKPCH